MLLSAAGMMRWKGFCEEAIHAALIVENQLKCNPQLSEMEIEVLARSVMKYPAGPRLETCENDLNAKIARFRKEAEDEEV